MEKWIEGVLLKKEDDLVKEFYYWTGHRNFPGTNASKAIEDFINSNREEWLKVYKIMDSLWGRSSWGIEGLLHYNEKNNVVAITINELIKQINGFCLNLSVKIEADNGKFYSWQIEPRLESFYKQLNILKNN